MATVNLNPTKNIVANFSGAYYFVQNPAVLFWSNQSNPTRCFLIHFDLSSIPAGAVVTNAKIKFTEQFIEVGYFYLRRLASGPIAWTEAWDNQNGQNPISLANASGPYDSLQETVSRGYQAPVDRELNATVLVQEWLSGTPNYGLWLDHDRGPFMTGSGNTNVYTRQHGTVAQRPVLEVTYVSPPGQPGAFTSPIAAEKVNHNVQATWGAATDPDGDIAGYHLEYTVNNGTNWTLINSQNNVSRLVDTSTWPETTQARLRTRAYDSGNRLGPYRESSTFTIEHGAYMPSMIL